MFRVKCGGGPQFKIFNVELMERITGLLRLSDETNTFWKQLQSSLQYVQLLNHKVPRDTQIFTLTIFFLGADLTDRRKFTRSTINICIQFVHCSVKLKYIFLEIISCK